jgi:hypothetical protein
MIKFLKIQALAATVSCCLFSGAQAAPTIFAYNLSNDHIISFDAAAPGVLLSDVAPTGLAVGEFLIGLDFRPANGMLYSVAISTTSSRVVTVNPTTGAITAVGAGFTPLLATAPFYGIDFNPVPDRIRVINTAGLSVRLNPNDGTLAGTDTSLTYAVGDPGAANPPAVADVAYNNNVAGTPTTTLFGIDARANTLVRVGGVDGTPSPNTGVLTTIGSLGIVASTGAGGFDIQSGTGTAFAVMRVGPVATAVSNLYRVNLVTGAATLVGAVGGGADVDAVAIAPVAVVPPAVLIPTPALDWRGLALLLMGLGMVGAMALRRR